MKVETLQFGEIIVEEDKTINFEQGLPGFETLSEYVLLDTEPPSHFSFLQSIEEGYVSFLVTDPFTFEPNYDFELSEEVVKELEVERPEDVLLRVIVTVPEQMEQSTMNLLAPIVINKNTLKGRQIVLNDHKYRTKHPLFDKVLSGGGE